MGSTIIRFFKTPAGIGVMFLAGVLVVYTIFRSGASAKPVDSSGTKNIYVQKTPEVKIDDDLPELEKQADSVPEKKEAKSIIRGKTRKRYRRTTKQPVILPINLYTSKPSSNEINPENFAPFGRLVKCQLVVTIDSSRIDTPIIAMVLEDLIHNGVCIIPAGTELHGTASGGNMRDRIASDGSWKFVWRTRTGDNGLELEVKGLALDMEHAIDRNHWGITDGSAGLKGRVINTTDWAQLMAVAATFVSGIGEGLAQQIYTTDGTTSQYAYGGTFNDALGKGLEKAANLYAQQMLKTITRDGVFVRVPAGKQFYLYIQQTINLDDAAIGGNKIKNSEFLSTANRRQRSLRSFRTGTIRRRQ